MDANLKAEIKSQSLMASSKLIEECMNQTDPKDRMIRHAILTHTSIFVLAQNILAIAEDEAYAECVLVEAMEFKDMIMEACYDLQKKIKNGEFKRTPIKKGDKDGRAPENPGA